MAQIRIPRKEVWPLLRFILFLALFSIGSWLGISEWVGSDPAWLKLLLFLCSFVITAPMALVFTLFRDL